jgi:hypothetical protein
MVFVLACVAIITMLAVGAIGVNRARLRTAHIANEGGRAQASMQRAFEMGTFLLQADPNGFTWRDGTSLTIDDPALAGRPMVQLVDPDDADLTAGTSSRVRLIASGYDGPASKRIRADFIPDVRPLPALEHALVVTGTRTLLVLRSIAGTEYNSTSYHPADVVHASASQFAISGMNGLLVPGPEVVTLWAGKGTRIDIDDISSRTVNGQLLAPMVNPYGVGNAQGIYVIDCENKSLRVRRSRVVGTLVIINVGTGSSIDDVSFEALPGQPALLVGGNITFNSGADDVTESSVNRNLNPTNAPYLDVTDTDETDTYPVGVRGIAYIAGNVTMTSFAVAGTLIIDGNLGGVGAVSATAMPGRALVEGFQEVTAWRLDTTSIAPVSE